MRHLLRDPSATRIRKSCALKAAPPGRAHILSIRLQQARLHVVRRYAPRISSRSRFAAPARHREHHFAALEQIAGHPVRASAVDLRLAAVGKAEDAAVLEKTPHDGTHPNPLAQALHSRPQRAHAANDQIDLHACLRRRIERLDQRRSSSAFIFATIAAGRPALACSASRAISSTRPSPQRQRRHQQRRYVSVSGLRRQVVETFCTASVISGREVSRLMSV